MQKISYKPLFTLPVIVAALGYFVDVYDLLVFNIVRVPSLTELGLNEEQISKIGTKILNWQQAGLLLGGIFWGMLGDKRGRLSVLFGSIITYSIANVACGFVNNPDVYALLRFVAGLGLAGELGAGITLVSEILPKQLRGYGSSIVAGVGLAGAVVAFKTSTWFDWRTTYFVGGGLGLGLLLLRVSVLESALYEKEKVSNVEKGNFLSFFTDSTRLKKYLFCIGMGLPTYFVIGLLATFGNEFGKALGIEEEIKSGLCVTYVFIGTVVGDLLSGPFSHWIHSRKKAIGLMILLALSGCVFYLLGNIKTANTFYITCGYLGFSIGYIAIFLQVTSEQFGTNLRATATSTVANFVRATTLITLPIYQNIKGSFGVINSALLIGAIYFTIAFISIYFLDETIDKDLDFVE